MSERALAAQVENGEGRARAAPPLPARDGPQASLPTVPVRTPHTKTAIPARRITPTQEDTVAGQAAQDLRTELDELDTGPCEPRGAKG
ncbi:hypothetical protein AB0D78_38605 [Streptomyces avermitilis]|uniref:hypothetical protein n=1 Tax=Streptomyces avermitilis TaxID=33903 RepID=UPI003403370D